MSAPTHLDVSFSRKNGTSLAVQAAKIIQDPLSFEIGQDESYVLLKDTIVDLPIIIIPNDTLKFRYFNINEKDEEVESGVFYPSEATSFYIVSGKKILITRNPEVEALFLDAPMNNEEAWELFQRMSDQQRLTLFMKRQKGEGSALFDEVLRGWWRARY